MKKQISIFFLMMLILLGATGVQGDRITLKNGGKLDGVIVEQDEVQITLRTAGGTISMPRSVIESIEITPRGQTHLELGDSFFHAGQLDKAEAEYELALAEQDSFEKARLALIRVEKERARTLAEEIETAAQHAQRIALRGDYERAVSYLTQLLNTQYPNQKILIQKRAEIRLQLADNYINHHRYGQAKETLLLASQDGASPVRLHTLMGIINQREGRFAQAREEFHLARKAADAEQRTFLARMEKEAAEEEARIKRLHARASGQVPPELAASTARILSQKELIREYIERASKQYKVDPLLVEAVIFAESGFRVDAISRAGALGLMQLMPGTAQDMGVEDPMDPEQNIRGGTRYLSLMLKEFKGDLSKALAAYNAGPYTVHIYGGIPPYRETRAYVPKVINHYNRLRENGSSLSRTG